MEKLGTPISIQNTKAHGWLVRWDDAVLEKTESGDLIESVSFTVSVRREATLTVNDMQKQALIRAIELLQRMLNKWR